MDIFKKLFNKRKKSVTFTQAVTNLNGLNGFENPYDTLNLNTFKKSIYLYIGISMIRETISSIDLDLYKILNNEGDVEQIHDDALIDLMQRPNYLQTKKEFWKLAVSYYLLAGETFWLIDDENAKGQPESMVNLRPDRVEILLSPSKKEIVGYEYIQSNGTVVKIPVESILHIKDVDPTNEVRGVGVIRPATQRIITEREVSTHQAQTFRSQGKPDVAIFMEDELDQEQIDEARERWNKNMNSQKGSKISFFGGNTKSMQTMPITPKEMDFIESQKFLRDDILASLKIPKAMVTSDDVNLANSKTARINYLKEAVQPVLDAFIDVINNKYLVDRNRADDRFVTYESPVQEDRELVLKEATELYKAELLTKNEARAILSYPEVETGEEFFANSSPFQLSMFKAKLKKKAIKVIRSRPILKKKFIAVKELAGLFNAQEKEVKREQNPVFHSKEMKEKYIKAFNNNIDKKAKPFKDHVDFYNQGLEKRILKQMEDFGANPTNIFNASEEMNIAKGIFEPLMEEMSAKTGQETLNSVANGFSEKAAEQFYSSEALLRSIELRAEFFIGSMLNTDFKELAAIITLNLQEGKGVDEIGRAIRLYFEDMSVGRARTIARTETSRLVSQATQDAYIQSEIVTGKQWLTAGDSKVRPEHVQNDMQVVAPGGVFASGEQYPGQNSINCRCAIAPTV